MPEARPVMKTLAQVRASEHHSKRTKLGKKLGEQAEAWVWMGSRASQAETLRRLGEHAEMAL